METTKEILTPKDIADLTGYSVRYIWNLIRSGQGPKGYRRANHIIFYKEDFMEWFNSQFKEIEPDKKAK